MLNPYRYKSGRYDTETGLYYLNPRYYDPDIGRFINADDISRIEHYVLTANYNLYAYAYNNPIKYVDENGDAAIVIGGVTISVAAAIILSASIAIAFLSAIYPEKIQQVCNISRDAIEDFFNACKSRATTVWEKIRKSGRNNSHHIVAQTACRAEEARQILRLAGIEPISDLRNRVDLKQRFHQKLHTVWYYESVNAVFRPFRGSQTEDVSRVLFTLKIILATINLVQ